MLTINTSNGLPSILRTMMRPAPLACGALLGGALLAAPALALPQATAGATARVTGTQTSETSESSSYSDGTLTVKVTKRTKRWVDERGNARSDEQSDVKATLDGKEVPADRIRMAGDLVEILDASGAVIRSAPAPQLGGVDIASVKTGAGAGDRFRFIAKGAADAAAQADALSGVIGMTSVNPPKVMLGVTMETPDEGIAEQLKIAPSEATIIMSVTPDLPAAKAGLKRHDVIVSVDGSKPANPQRIREVMGSKEPGSTMKLGVVSGGEARDLTVTLEAWDAERLGVGARAAAITLDTGLPVGTVDRDMQDQIDAMMQQFHIQFEGLDLSNQDATINRYFAPAPGGSGRTFTFVMPGNAIPGTPVAPTSTTEDRIRLLEERIDKLNETIRLLEERLKSTEPKR
jgi:hypothetical protein